MGEVVDLSIPLDASTQVYPGDPVFVSSPATTIGAEGFHVQHISMGSQTGTHVDAPWHFAEDGLRIDEVPLERFVRRLVVADVRGLSPRTVIGWDRLATLDLGPDAALVLHTGWSAHRGTDAYFDHPYLDAAACAQVLDRGVRTFGLDAPNLDETRFDRHPSDGFASHRLIAAVGGVIVENLCGLDDLGAGPYLLSVLPLRLAGADGAPCRAVALRLGD
ncbi:cyclase family protein [Acidothermaceae bacterium B102]|nr:cyclase family protein [Acidothermaceae bacterium B102]